MTFVDAAFDRLHPAVRHHVRRSMGWCRLWPIQAAAAEPLLDGEDGIVAGPPGGGRFVAATLPLFSRMLSEAWEGTSVLCLVEEAERAEHREDWLEEFGRTIGRRPYHVLAPADLDRRERPDALVTDLASLAAILAGGAVAGPEPLADLRAVVLDDVEEAFRRRAEDTLDALARLEALALRPLQRIGLCGAGADADRLLHWLSPSGRAGVVIEHPDPDRGREGALERS